MIQIDLYSGPPWGFRISQDQELRPIIGQIIPGGRGDIAGLKIGDLIRKIGIISVATCQQAHSLMHATRDKLTLVIERNPRRENVSNSVQNSPRSNEMRRANVSVPNSPRQIRMDMMAGSKNSTDIKRRLFEDFAEENSPSMVDHLLKKKILDGKCENTGAPSSSSIGYDSVAPDFAGSSEKSSRRSSSSSQESKIVLEEDEVTILENTGQGEENNKEMQTSQDIFNNPNVSLNPQHNSGYYPAPNQWNLRTQHNNNIMPAQGDIEIPERRGVAALRQVINDRLEMKTPVGGVSASSNNNNRPKTPQQQTYSEKPSWAANVKVYEPDGYVDPHANKNSLGRVLDGPVEPTKYFQGVPPPSFSITGHKITPQPIVSKPPAPRTSTTIRLPPEMSQHTFRPTFIENSLNHEDIDDGASMISSCISTFGESSEVAALSAAGSQRYLYDQYRRGLLNEKTIPEEMSTSITSTKSEITPPVSIFNTDIQLTPFGQVDKPRGRSSSMDLESSELLVKSKSPAPYNSQSADHFGTIRRKHTPVRMEVTPTPTEQAAPVEQRNYDSGYEGSNAISPDTQANLDKALSEAFELASSLSSSINLPNESFMTPSSSSLNNDRPESFIISSPSSHTPRLSQQENIGNCNIVGSLQDSKTQPTSDLLDVGSMPKRHEPEMSQWYRQMFKQMHKTGVDEPRGGGEHLDLATISQGRVTPQKVEVEIEPRRARSVGRVVEQSEGSPSNLASEIEDLKRISREEVLIRQKAEKLTDELQKEKERKHNYIPSSAPSLQNNMDRFEGLVNNYSTTVNPRQSAPPTTTTATVIYRFDGRSNRELSLLKGDIVRIIREVDSHWLEGERNGKIGIFPASYVQIDSEYDNRNRQKMRAIYPFTSRNSNELSLKKGEIITFRREIDQNWMEGTNQIGTIGIFPSSYVRLISIEPQSHDTVVIPDRPKTPKINHEEPTTHKVRFENEPRIQKDDFRSRQDEIIQNIFQDSKSSCMEYQRKPEYATEQNYHRKQPEAATVIEKPKNDIRTNAAAVIPKGSEMYRAAFAYRPQKEDELELFVNDIIFVVEKCDDGWFIGTSLRSGDFGIFPGNYVQRH